MNRKLCKSRYNVKISGVCGGIGEYFNIDPTIIRVCWVIAILFAGTGLFAYIICAVIMPRADDDMGYKDYRDQYGNQEHNQPNSPDNNQQNNNNKYQ